MEEFIKNYLKKYNLKYYKITNPSSLEQIYNLYYHGPNENDYHSIDDTTDLYFGIYYKIHQNYDQMKKYYLMAIEKGCPDAMNNLGFYYKGIKDYDQMKKYYLMAIEEDHCSAMYNLGLYYDEVEKNYDLMKKYYLMAIERGDSDAMNNLGLYYHEVEKDYDLMKKYYSMAIEKGDSDAAYNLGLYYGKVEKDYVLMEKYYLISIEKGSHSAFLNLKLYYRNNNNALGLLKLCIKNNNMTELSNTLVDYFNQNILNEEINLILLEYLDKLDETKLPVSLKLYKQLLNKQLDLLDLHFKYTENGLGFNEAKKDYYQQLSSLGQ